MEQWARDKLEKCREEMVQVWEGYLQMAQKIGCERAYLQLGLQECQRLWDGALKHVPVKAVITNNVPEDEYDNLQKMCMKLRQTVREQNKTAYTVLEVLKGRIDRQDTTIDYIHTTLYKEVMALREALFRKQHPDPHTEFKPEEFSLIDFMKFADNHIRETADVMAEALRERMTLENQERLSPYLVPLGMKRKELEWQAKLDAEREEHRKEVAELKNELALLRNQITMKTASLKAHYEAEAERLRALHAQEIELLGSENEEKLKVLQARRKSMGIPTLISVDVPLPPRETASVGTSPLLTSSTEPLPPPPPPASWQFTTQPTSHTPQTGALSPSSVSIDAAPVSEDRENLMKVLDATRKEINTIHTQYKLRIKAMTLEWETALVEYQNSCQKDIEEAQKAKDHIEAQLNAAQGEVATATARMAEMKKVIANLENKLSSEEQKTLSVQSEMTAVKREHEDLAEKYNSVLSRAKVLEKSLKEAKESPRSPFPGSPQSPLSPPHLEIPLVIEAPSDSPDSPREALEKALDLSLSMDAAKRALMKKHSSTMGKKPRRMSTLNKQAAEAEEREKALKAEVTGLRSQLDKAHEDLQEKRDELQKVCNELLGLWEQVRDAKEAAYTEKKERLSLTLERDKLLADMQSGKTTEDDEVPRGQEGGEDEARAAAPPTPPACSVEEEATPVAPPQPMLKEGVKWFTDSIRNMEKDIAELQEEVRKYRVQEEEDRRWCYKNGYVTVLSDVDVVARVDSSKPVQHLKSGTVAKVIHVSQFTEDNRRQSVVDTAIVAKERVREHVTCFLKIFEGGYATDVPATCLRWMSGTEAAEYLDTLCEQQQEQFAGQLDKAQRTSASLSKINTQLREKMRKLQEGHEVKVPEQPPVSDEDKGELYKIGSTSQHSSPRVGFMGDPSDRSPVASRRSSVAGLSRRGSISRPLSRRSSGARAMRSLIATPGPITIDTEEVLIGTEQAWRSLVAAEALVVYLSYQQEFEKKLHSLALHKCDDSKEQEKGLLKTQLYQAKSKLKVVEEVLLEFKTGKRHRFTDAEPLSPTLFTIPEFENKATSTCDLVELGDKETTTDDPIFNLMLEEAWDELTDTSKGRRSRRGSTVSGRRSSKPHLSGYDFTIEPPSPGPPADVKPDDNDQDEVDTQTTVSRISSLVDEPDLARVTAAFHVGQKFSKRVLAKKKKRATSKASVRSRSPMSRPDSNEMMRMSSSEAEMTPRVSMLKSLSTPSGPVPHHSDGRISPLGGRSPREGVSPTRSLPKSVSPMPPECITPTATRPEQFAKRLDERQQPVTPRRRDDYETALPLASSPGKPEAGAAFIITSIHRGAHQRIPRPGEKFVPQPPPTSQGVSAARPIARGCSSQQLDVGSLPEIAKPHSRSCRATRTAGQTLQKKKRDRFGRRPQSDGYWEEVVEEQVVRPKSVNRAALLRYASTQPHWSSAAKGQERCQSPQKTDGPVVHSYYDEPRGGGGIANSRRIIEAAYNYS